MMYLGMFMQTFVHYHCTVLSAYVVSATINLKLLTFIERKDKVIIVFVYSLY